jgi:hypothetical protein
LALIGLAIFVVFLDKPGLVKLVIAIHGAWLVAIAFNLDFVYQGLSRLGVVAVREMVVSLLTGPPQEKWSTFIVSLRRIKNGKQKTKTGRNCNDAATG